MAVFQNYAETDFTTFFGAGLYCKLALHQMHQVTANTQTISIFIGGDEVFVKHQLFFNRRQLFVAHACTLVLHGEFEHQLFAGLAGFGNAHNHLIGIGILKGIAN